MRRVTAILSTLGLTADRAKWFADHVCGRYTRTTRWGEDSLPDCYVPEASMDTHKQAHAGAQRVLAKLQLRWYWPYMESEMRRRVRQCETCQASKHGCPPDKAGRWKRHVERPWKVEAVNLAGSMCGAPQRDVVRRGRPLPAREVCQPAPKPPPPLLEPSTSSEVQKPSRGRGSIRRHQGNYTTKTAY